MKPTRQTGFTLVELILVIVLMGILAGVAVPRLTNRQPEDEITVRDQLKATLRFARQVATSQNRPVCFMRTAAQFSLVYANGAGACVLAGAPVIEPGSGNPFVVTLPSSVVLTNASTVQFNARGQLAPNAVNQTVTVGSQPTLTIDRETGFVY